VHACRGEGVSYLLSPLVARSRHDLEQVEEGAELFDGRSDSRDLVYVCLQTG